MDYERIIDFFPRVFFQFKASVTKFLPNLISAAAIILIGLIVAKVFRGLIHRFLKNLNRFIPSKKIQSQLSASRMERTATLISNILYWIVLFFFVTAATEVLGLPIVTTWLGGIVSYLPKILLAVLICAAGIVGGVLIRDIITAGTASAGITYGNLLGKLAQYVIILVSILIATDHVNIEIAFLTNLILIFIATILFGGTLAFGLGARTSVSNILASYYLQKVYKVGDTVRIENTKGKIVQINPTTVILETLEGQVCVPAKEFNEKTSILLREDK